ncbi:MAG: hypothetical protein ABIC40_06135 [bacterium]
MTRSILSSILTLFLVIILCGTAAAQDFMLRESDPAVVASSLEQKAITNVFEDTNNDGIFDTAIINGLRVEGSIRVADAEGFKYEDGRNIVLYPSEWTGLPKPGASAILGFIHYFDEKNISTYLAIVAQQALGDDTTHGLGVFFYDSSGLRVGAPTTMFMEKSHLRVVPIYQEWVAMGKDFGIGTNPVNSQFFVYVKELGLTDYVLLVMFQLYQ